MSTTKYTPLPKGYTDGNIQADALAHTKTLGRIGPGSQYISRCGWCGHCGTTWDFVEGHSTQYTSHYGCFPLCEECWAEMTPAERLPYYRELYDSWNDPTYASWRDIERAVLAGG